MAGTRDPAEPADPRLAAARYRSGAEAAETDDAMGRPTMEQRAQIVEIEIAQAMRRGDFDDLPGAGKPLTGLGASHDPDWWIRRKIERERLTGLGPPALMLRGEDAGLDDELDRLGDEAAVRARLADFNRRVVDARRQLLGGPPVITPLRDPDVELERWRARRDERGRIAREREEADRAALAALPRRERRRVLRERGRTR